MSDGTVSDEAGRIADERATTRATPLPEERVGESTREEREAGAEEILRESEQRIEGAADGVEPADDATQRRRSEETL